MSLQSLPVEQSVADSVSSQDERLRNDSAYSEQISVMDLATMIADRRRFVFLVTGIVVVLTAVVSLLLPNWYTANVTLMPPQQGSSLSTALAAQMGSLGSLASMAGGSLGLKNPNDMYVAMLRSRTVEDAMIQRFGLMERYRTHNYTDARKAFERHAKVDGSGKDGLIHISFEDRDPGRAATMANAYVDQFRDLSKHLAITEASQRRAFLEQQLLQAKDNLASAEESLKDTEQKTGLIQLDNQARALIETAAGLRAQIVAKEVQIQSMRTFATDENSQLVQANQELQSLRAQLAKLGGNGDNVDASLLVPKGRVPQAGLEYVRKLRDVKYYEAIFEILARQFEAAKLDEARQGAVIQVIDAAVPPDKKSFPMRTIMVLCAVVIGFLLGSFIVVARGIFHAMLASPESGPGLRRFLAAFRHKQSAAFR